MRPGDEGGDFYARSAGAIAAVTIAVALAAFSSSAHASAHAGSSYAPAGVATCLTNNGVISGIIPLAHPKAEYRKLLPSGLTNEVSIMSGFGPKIDPGALYFFRTSALAKAGEAKLVPRSSS